ncbi:MAG: 16S rRNA (cytosine(1402)-N(4))-methyltransferase [Gemmatimonadetes bacterium]|nr:16S rRNA (cytosine(1402)-N(4))-methyltransferase [Gemmatimonadota bacterium]
MEKAPEYHVPVLGPEVVEHLITDPDGTYVDATLGGGGHAELILEQLGSEGRLIGVDRDPVAIATTSQRLARYGKRFDQRQIPFWQLPDTLGSLGVEGLDGALFDLGVSSRQIDDAARGFSYRQDGPLDMRMGPDASQTAEQVVNQYSERDLTRVFREYGEERASTRIARSIVRGREEEPIRSTQQLVDLVTAQVPERFATKSLARIFQGIRIEVNGELDHLEPTLNGIVDRLVTGGRLAVLTYHSLEDRVVKRVVRGTPQSSLPRDFPVADPNAGKMKELVRRGITASEDEVAVNPRARSAKLRIGVKV